MTLSDGYWSLTLVLSFADSHNVVAKGNHVIDGCQLKVSLERPIQKLPADPCKLHITGLSERTTRDTLMSFMEVATGLEVLGVDFGAKANAIVTFDGAPGRVAETHQVRSTTIVVINVMLSGYRARNIERFVVSLGVCIVIAVCYSI